MPVLGEIFSPDILIVGAVIIVLLFGGSKLPELARSLGSAKAEFEKGSRDRDSTRDATPSASSDDEA